MRSKALAAAIGSIAAGACAGRPPPASFASPTFLPGAPAPRASDPMPPEEAPMEAPTKVTVKGGAKAPVKVTVKAPADLPRERVRVVTAPPIRIISADSAASKAAKPAKTAESSRPARQARQDEPARPARQDEPARRDESARQDEPARRDEPARQDEPARRDEPARQDEPAKPAKTAEPAKPTKAAAPPCDDDRDDRPRAQRGDGHRTDPKAAAPPCDDDRPGLRAPHRGTAPPPPKLRAPADLHALVGRRDARDALAAVAAWSRELGAPFSATSGAALVSWAAESRRLRSPDEEPRPGDLLVFDQATSDDPSDLVAIVLDCDERGVTEFLYLAAGVVRRGLVDASRPAIHRDGNGATVNTYLRHGRRWPGKGMHYLAGELLGHVIRMR
jgi:hypothetical protein